MRKSRRKEENMNNIDGLFGYVWKKKGDWFFLFVVYFFLLMSFVVTLYPLIFTVSASVSDPKAVASGQMLLFPVKFTLV